MSVTEASVVEEPSTGLVIEIAGASTSRRVTETDSVVELLEPSVQVTSIVLLPKPTGMTEPLAGEQVGAVPELSDAVYASVTDASVVVEPSIGLEIEMLGATLSRRVTETDSVLELLEPSVQVTDSVLLPKTSAWLLPEAGEQVGATPELSVAV